jgi:hypothetical protein
LLKGLWAVCSMSLSLGFCSGYALHLASFTSPRIPVSKSRHGGHEVSTNLKGQILLAYFGPFSKSVCSSQWSLPIDDVCTSWLPSDSLMVFTLSHHHPTSGILKAANFFC